MASSYNTVWKSTPTSDWTANGPAESGHNFLDQIKQQDSKVAAQEGQLANQRAQAETSRQAYQDAYTNQQDYGQMYQTAKGTEGVNDARDQYQRSLDAVNATQSAMNNLPSSINAGSNVVLNNAQRSAALGNQMNKYQNTLSYWTNQNQGDLSNYQMSLQAAQDLAAQQTAQQQAKVAQTLQEYQSELNQVNNAYNQLLQERQLVRSIYGDMYEDEYQHMQDAIEVWAQQLAGETERYVQDQNNQRQAAQLAAQKELTEYEQQQQNQRQAAKIAYNRWAQEQENARAAEQANISRYLNSGYIWDGDQWVMPTEQPVQPERQGVTVDPYIESPGYYYTPETGKGRVAPIITTKDDGTQVYNYVADANMMANITDPVPKRKVDITSIGSSGNGAYDLYLSNGKHKQYLAKSEEEARQKYYRDNPE